MHDLNRTIRVTPPVTKSDELARPEASLFCQIYLHDSFSPFKSRKAPFAEYQDSDGIALQCLRYHHLKADSKINLSLEALVNFNGVLASKFPHFEAN